MRWNEFVAVERDLFANAGLPGNLADRRLFLYFLEHGYVEDGSAFSVDDLDSEQRRALRQLVLLYLERFEPGVDPEMNVSWFGLR